MELLRVVGLQVRVNRSLGTSIWSNISKLKVIFWQNVSFQVQVGDRIILWDHLWLGNTVLKTRYPKIFSLCQLQQDFIKDFGRMEGNQISWNLHLRRNLRDSEFPELADLLTVLSKVQLFIGEDKLVWRSDKKGNFSGGNCYSYLLRNRNCTLPSNGLPLKFFWNWRIPCKS